MNVAVQPRKVEHAGVSRHGVAEGHAEETALFHGARAVLSEPAGVEFANRPPAGAVVLESGFYAAIQPDDPEPRPRLCRRESQASNDTGEVPVEFAVNGQRAKSVVIRPQLRVRQRVVVVFPGHANNYGLRDAGGTDLLC